MGFGPDLGLRFPRGEAFHSKPPARELSPLGHSGTSGHRVLFLLESINVVFKTSGDQIQTKVRPDPRSKPPESQVLKSAVRLSQARRRSGRGKERSARLVVFPHAGGGPSTFASWQEQHDIARIPLNVVSMHDSGLQPCVLVLLIEMLPILV
jgi:hypothetical protein